MTWQKCERSVWWHPSEAFISVRDILGGRQIKLSYPGHPGCEENVWPSTELDALVKLAADAGLPISDAVQAQIRARVAQ